MDEDITAIDLVVVLTLSAILSVMITVGAVIYELL